MSDEILDELKSFISVQKESGKTNIYVVVKDLFDSLENKTLEIDCESLTNTSPSGYSVSRDSIFVKGVDYIKIGSFDHQYFVKLDDDISINIPLPESIIMKCIDQNGEEIYNDVLKKYPKNLYSHTFITLVR